MSNDKEERPHIKRTVTSEPLRDPQTGHVRLTQTIQILTEDLDESEQRSKRLESDLNAERRHREALQSALETLQQMFGAMTARPALPTVTSKQLSERHETA